MRMNRQILAILVAASLSGVTQATQSAPSSKGVLQIELNTVEQFENNCRVAFVARNALAANITSITLELVLFGSDGGVDRFLLVDLGTLPRNRTRVRQFDIENGSCTGFSRILINDVTACEGGDLTPQDCLNSIEPSRRDAVAGMELES